MNRVNFDIQRFASVIHGKSSSDKITNTENNSQVYGLGGNDTIESSKNNVTLIGGSGNDLLIAGAGTTTLNGGNGNDTFGFTYSPSEKVSALIEDIDPNKDQIMINYNGNSTPNLNYKTIGDDLLLSDDKGYLNVTIKGSIPLDSYYDEEGNDYLWDVLRIVNENRENKGLAPLTFSQGLMNGASTRSDEIVDYFSHTRPNGTSCFTVLDSIYSYTGENIAAGQSSPSEVMTSWMNSTGHRENILNSDFTKLGVGYKYRSGTTYGDYWVQMFSGSVSTKNLSKDNILNTKTTLMLNYSTKSDSTLKEMTSLELVNKNGTSGKDTIKNSDDNIAIDALSGDDLIINGQWYAEKGGVSVKINGGAGNDTITNSGSKSLLDGSTGDDLIYNGYYYYEPWGADGFLNDSYNQDYNDTEGSSNVTIEGGAGNDTINNRGSKVTISGGSGNDTITKDSSANYNVFQYSSGDGDDVIYGFTENDTLRITGSYTKSTVGNDVVVNIGRGSVTLKETINKTINIVTERGGYIPSEPDPEPVDNETAVTLESSFTGIYNDYEDSIIKIDAANVTSAIKIYGNDNNNTIIGGSKADTISGAGGKDVINGGAGNDKLYGNDGNDKLNGDNGNDTLEGGAGADTLTGGAGKDVFYYSDGDGNDIITDYSASQGDIIQLGVSSMSTSKSGTNVILKIDSGKITVNKGTSQKITVVGASGKSTVISSSSSSGGTSTNTLKSGLAYSSDKKTLTVKSPFTGTIDLSKYASIITNVNASTDTKFVSIKGTSRTETFKAGKGGSILTGGKGSDKLYGGNGADTFVYASGDGKDTIYNYTSYIDTIKISKGIISKATVNGKNVVLSIGSGSLTVQNAKGKDINITDSSGETATYNFTKTVNNPTTSNYIERWFSKDDTNFTTSDISSLLKSDNLISNDYNFSFNKELQSNRSDDITSLTYSYNHTQK